jgi:hypothetical protein
MVGGIVGRKNMYYNRTISDSFSELIREGGALRWLFDYVKGREDLDFLVGRNDSTEWISVYRGLTRIVRIQPINKTDKIHLDAAIKYKGISPDLYGIKPAATNFSDDLDNLVHHISKDHIFDRYYNNKKEGYYQNVFSRKYGICGKPDDEFVIVYKEAVIGYTHQNHKNFLFGSIQNKYKRLQKDISILDAKRYGRSLEKKAIGNELDFVALDRNGNILLIEYKHGTNTAGIYLSPLQIGLYYDLFKSLKMEDLECAVQEMLYQKQLIGLVNPLWSKPSKIKDVIPVLIISEYHEKSSAKEKFQDILDFVKTKNGVGFLGNLKRYNFAKDHALSDW